MRKWIDAFQFSKALNLIKCAPNIFKIIEHFNMFPKKGHMLTFLTCILLDFGFLTSLKCNYILKYDCMIRPPNLSPYF